MATRYETSVPDQQGSPAPSTTPGSTPRRESVHKVSQWTEKLASLQEQVDTTEQLLEDLKPMLEVDLEFAQHFHLDERIVQVTNLQQSLSRTLTIASARQISAIRWKDLSIAGVHDQQRVLSAVTLHQALVGGRREGDIEYVQATEEGAGELYDDYKTWGGAMNIRTEAAARTHVECVIRRMLPLSEKFKFHPQGPGRTLTCPELVLSNAADKTKIPSGPGARRTLSVTGRTDYTHIHIPNWRSLDPLDRDILLDELKSLAIVEGNGDSFSGFANVCLSIIETKRITISGDDLVSHLPQAIVEALVLSLRSQGESDTPSTVPFILTNGFEWIFGFLRKMDSSIVGDPQWECCRTEPFVIPSYGLIVDEMEEAGDETEEARKIAKEAREEAREKTKAALRIVLEMLLHWTCEERAAIVQNAS